MMVTPLQDRVLVELDPAETDFGSSGILRPDIAEDMPRVGTVRAVGPGVRTRRGFRATTLMIGDRVHVPWRRGTTLTIDGRRHVFVREFSDGDIVAVQR